MNLKDEPFEVRRAVVRVMGRHLLDMPIDVAFLDQLAAAARDTHTGIFEPSAALASIWGGREVGVPMSEAQEGTERLIAALMGCDQCVHLRRGGPRPGVVDLGTRRVVCQRCAHTVVRPPADEGDRCDVCGSRGHQMFWAFMARVGPILFTGNAASCCADSVLRQAVEA